MFRKKPFKVLLNGYLPSEVEILKESITKSEGKNVSTFESIKLSEVGKSIPATKDYQLEDLLKANVPLDYVSPVIVHTEPSADEVAVVLDSLDKVDKDSKKSRKLVQTELNINDHVDSENKVVEGQQEEV